MSNGSTHTPGPWRMEYSDSSNILIEFSYTDADGNRHSGNIGLVDSMRGPQNVANARLIAAAPELLEACKAIADSYASDGNTKKQQAAHALIHAAIAKAEGRQ